MGSGGRNNPRGARYWLVTALVTWLLLMTPMPFTLLAFGWLVYRIRKYMDDRKKEASKVTSKLNTRLVNLMLRNNKQIINAEVLDEDERFIKVVDAGGKELLINKSDVAVIEPIAQELD
jgi:hypothetical protein